MISTLIKSPGFELLCLSINQGDSNEVLRKAEQLIRTNNIDWADLYFRAEINAVKPQVGRLLNKMPPELVPEKIIKELNEATRENLYLQLQNISEYFKIKKLLDEAGIPAIPFKGFWLAHEYYDNLSDRESVDVDLFIKPGDLEKIKSLMFGMGYVAEEPLPQLTADFILNELCEYNFDQYNGDTRLFHFEFHWRISLNLYGLNINLDELQSQVTAGTLQNREIKVFTASAHLLLAIMHHGGKDQFLQLKQVLDIARILKKQPEIDWEWVAGKAKKYHMENLLYVSIKLASLLTGLIIPGQITGKVNTGIILSLANNRVRMMDEKRSRNKNLKSSLNNFYFQLRSRSSTRLRIRLIANEFRTGILTKLVPQKFRTFFLNKKIRVKPANNI